MAQIDNTYFIRGIELPGTAIDGDREDLTPYITQYEKEVLINLLGYPLYKDFIANPGNDRWVNLIIGKEYEVDYLSGTTTVKWNGLVNTEKLSFIAYYIYYFYMKFHVSNTSRTGESISEKENAKSISPSDKMVPAWNNYVELYGCISDLIINPTAYNFLKKFEDDYDGWLFTPTKKINTFSL